MTIPQGKRKTFKDEMKIKMGVLYKYAQMQKLKLPKETLKERNQERDESALRAPAALAEHQA